MKNGEIACVVGRVISVDPYAGINRNIPVRHDRIADGMAEADALVRN